MHSNQLQTSHNRCLERTRRTYVSVTVYFNVCIDRGALGAVTVLGLHRRRDALNEAGHKESVKH
jgi:hypothetical protein